MQGCIFEFQAKRCYKNTEHLSYPPAGIVNRLSPWTSVQPPLQTIIRSSPQRDLRQLSILHPPSSIYLPRIPSDLPEISSRRLLLFPKKAGGFQNQSPFQAMKPLFRKIIRTFQSKSSIVGFLSLYSNDIRLLGTPFHESDCALVRLSAVVGFISKRQSGKSFRSDRKKTELETAV